MRAEITTIDENVVVSERNLTRTHLWVDGVETHRTLGLGLRAADRRRRASLDL
jgi:hypothetical protein